MSRLVSVLLLVALLSAGCRKVDTVLNDNFPTDGGEYWEELTLDDKPAGFQRTSLIMESDGGDRFLRYESQSRLTVLRHGQRFDVSMSVESRSRLEPTGSIALQTCTTRLSGGSEPVETVMEVVADEQGHRLRVAGAQSETFLPWIPTMAGPEAIVDSFRKDPPTLKKLYMLQFFDPTLQKIYTVSLMPEKMESVSWNGQSWNLLRIDMAGAPYEAEQSPKGTAPQISGTLWTDAQGRIIQSELSMPGDKKMRARRVSREKALAALDEAPQVELGALGIVPLNRGLFLPHQTPTFRFLVKTESGTPFERFPTTSFQALSVIGPDSHFARITTWSASAHKPPDVGNTAYGYAHEAAPGDMASGGLINLEDPRLLELAATVETAGLSDWEVAVALEKLVHETIRTTSFSLAFASSSDVLETRQGDCSEFAVLLAALCRVKGIPARLTLGLVYTPLGGTSATEETDAGQTKAAMSFHLWNEVLVGGVWRPLDATVAVGGADAARLKITDDNLAGDSLAPLTNAILDVIDRITVNVEE